MEAEKAIVFTFDKYFHMSLDKGQSADDLYRKKPEVRTLGEVCHRSMAAGCQAGTATVPAGSLLTPTEEKEINAILSVSTATRLDEIYKVRLPRVVEDIADYARRQTFTFDREEGDADRYSGQHWMSDEDMNQTMLAMGGRGSRSRATEEADGRISLTLGQCLMRVIDDLSERQLSNRSSYWIFHQLNYSLDWVIYGIGTPKLNRYAPQELDWELPKVTGMERIPTLAMLKTLRTTTSWTSMEWSWLLGTTTRTQYRCTYPTLPLAARIVSGWGIEPCAPALPEPPVFVNWLWKWLAGEFIAPGSVFAKEEWKQNIIATCVRSKTRLYLLLGVTTQSGSQYGREIMAPSASITRACYYIEMVVRRWGREGFLNVLDILDQEARDRGFEGLPGVFEKRTWNFRNKKFTTEKADAEDSGAAKKAAVKKVAGKNARGSERAAAAETVDAAMAAMKRDMARMEEPGHRSAEQGANPLDTVRVVQEKKKTFEDIEQAEGPAIKVRKGRGKKAVRR